MKYPRLNLAIPFLLSCFLNSALATPLIKVRVSEFPPNYYQKENGDWTGLGVELSTLIIETAGFKAQFSNQPWARSLESLKSGSIQYITNISKTDERSQFLNWIGPVRQGEVRLIVKAGNENLPIKTLADLVTVSKTKNQRFGYLVGFSYSEEFHRRFDSEPEFKDSFEPTSIGESNFHKVAKGRILGFFETSMSASYRIQNVPEYKDLVMHPFILRKTPVYHGISKKGVDEDTFKKINDAFITLQQSGSIQRIVDKYQQ